MPGGCIKSKQTSWGEGHSLPQGAGGGGHCPQRAEKAHWRPRFLWDESEA